MIFMQYVYTLKTNIYALSFNTTFIVIYVLLQETLFIDRYLNVLTILTV